MKHLEDAGITPYVVDSDYYFRARFVFNEKARKKDDKKTFMAS